MGWGPFCDSYLTICFSCLAAVHWPRIPYGTVAYFPSLLVCACAALFLHSFIMVMMMMIFKPQNHPQLCDCMDCRESNPSGKEGMDWGGWGKPRMVGVWNVCMCRMMQIYVKCFDTFGGPCLIRCECLSTLHNNHTARQTWHAQLGEARDRNAEQEERQETIM